MENQGIVEQAKGWTAASKDYFEDLKAEMNRVTWPTWKQVRATTTVVISMVFAFAAYFAVVDIVVARGVTALFDSLTR
ncbi:MAG: preprotein translocase subunit SecE [Acidobacteria bacterium]|nr:preprotein translocase subunit SecE [Acidobacteriota bacterium]